MRIAAESRFLRGMEFLETLPKIIIGERAIDTTVHVATKIAHKRYNPEHWGPINLFEHSALFLIAVCFFVILASPLMYGISPADTLHILLEEGIPSFEPRF